jgi:hypothetical protein
MPANKLVTAAGNFARAHIANVDAPQPSKAEVLGIPEPAMSTEQQAGVAVQARLASQKFNATLAAQQRYETEKAEYEKARDDAAWKVIEARRTAAIG